MIKMGGVSLRGFVIALRWASIKKYPNDLKEWTPEHNANVQAVAIEWDNRQMRAIR